VRIGVFGGSFDPVHRGHLAVAQQAVRELRLDQVRFVPALLQPLKTAGPRASPDDRAAMLRAALDGQPNLALDLREIRRPGPSFTVDTLRELRLERPHDELFLMVGADAAQDLHRWREADELARLATLVVVPRPGIPPLFLPAPAVTLGLEPIDLSATAVRDAAANGRDIDHLVPKAVADYIAAHRLYRVGAAC
jgi:nicotinate-nucleotide adenylyltransferase